MNHCLAIWDFGMEIKVRIIIFGSITSHCVCIFAPFVALLWHLIELLDLEMAMLDVKLNKQMATTN